jgi:hypothetical protein
VQVVVIAVAGGGGARVLPARGFVPTLSECCFVRFLLL